jgi:hypothetical protein
VRPAPSAPGPIAQRSGAALLLTAMRDPESSSNPSPHALGRPNGRLDPDERAEPSEVRIVSAAVDEEPPAARPRAAADGGAEAPAHADSDARTPPVIARNNEHVGARATPLAQPVARLPDAARATPSAQSAGRPPVLASEALRKELAPATPASAQVRQVTFAVGLIGLAAALIVCGLSGLGVPLGGTFLALSLLGIVPLPYQARAAALVTIAGSGLAVVTWSRLEHAVNLERLVLLVGILVLSMALLFRTWHRASLLARALVALGASVCAGWLVMSGALQRLLVLEAGWQQWLPAVLPLPLAVVLLLSLLAFMDSRSTGGCGAWAGLLLAWYAVYTWAELLPLYWPRSGFVFERVQPDLAMTTLSGPLFAIVLAAGLAQLLSVATAAGGE